MSGGQVAYQLRPNKAIDRFVFMEVLSKHQSYSSISDYTYVGFGGPFMEDFRLIHTQFGINKLISLESDEVVFARQKFNQPIACIECLQQTSGDFIANYNLKGNVIIWLDYASAKQRAAQIREYQALLPKLKSADLIKITLNANPKTLGEFKSASDRDEVAKKRFAKLYEDLGDFVPPSITFEDLLKYKNGFAYILYKTILRASSMAYDSSLSLSYLPLTAFSYADSEHTMLTVTLAILNRNEKKAYLEKTKLKNWDLLIRKNSKPLMIAVPNLSTRERLFIDTLLPTKKSRGIMRKLKFLCADSEEKTKEMLDSYTNFYRHLPYFSKIVP